VLSPESGLRLSLFFEGTCLHIFGDSRLKKLRGQESEDSGRLVRIWRDKTSISKRLSELIAWREADFVEPKIGVSPCWIEW
jgi:hypothetical protein